MKPGRSGVDIAAIEAALRDGGPIRLDLAGRGRLFMDRPMPFLVVHIGRRSEPAARDVAMASSAYLLARNLTDAAAVIRLVGAAMIERFGAFLVLDIGELAKGDYAGEAKTWQAMRQHMLVIADALAAALAKQFPARF